MAASDHLRGRTAYRLLTIIGIGLLATAAGLALASTPAAGQADVTFGTLTVPDANVTADGSVQDVRVSAQADYRYSVPDAGRYVVKLQVGPSADQLETVDFVSEDLGGGNHSGTVGLDGSILSSPAYSASDFEPPVAESVTRDVVVGLTLEVQRSGGDAVTQTVTEDVKITIHDDAVLTAEVGGVGSVSVTTG